MPQSKFHSENNIETSLRKYRENNLFKWVISDNIKWKTALDSAVSSNKALLSNATVFQSPNNSENNCCWTNFWLRLRVSQFSHFFLNFQGGALQQISIIYLFLGCVFCRRLAQKVTTFETGMPMDVLWLPTSHQQTHAFSKLVKAENGLTLLLE